MGTDLRRQRWIAATLLALAMGARAQAPAPVLDEALNAPARAHIINEFARRLTELHVDPGRAKLAADALRQHLARGDYDDQTTARALAARVTRDIAPIVQDRETYLEYVPYDLGDARQRPPAPAPGADNFGLRRFQLLDDGIGYMKITRFAPLDRAAVEAAGRFMAQAGDCPALIIDLRDAGGDGEAMAALLSSYLLDDQRSFVFKEKQIHLHDQLDRDGRVAAELWTDADVAGKRYGGRKPLYVLVNERTSGAAEAFAFDLQKYVQRSLIGKPAGGRALVIGAPTQGDARGGSKQRISRQLQTSIATTRASNYLSRSNWEGNGVQPDRMVTPAEALDTALALARQTMQAGAARR
jgi:C-terminal processing protease CtpA/Prc